MAHKLLKGALALASLLLIAQLANRRTRLSGAPGDSEADPEAGE